MSEGINRATLMGNLGAAPDLRFTNGGSAIMNIRMCTNTRYKDSDGEWKDRQEWHNVVVWGKRAEALDKILDKGSSVYVEGELRTSSYEKDGDKRYKTEIHATTVLLTGGKGEARGDRDSDRGRDDRGRDDGGRRDTPRGRNAAEETRRRADERHERGREEMRRERDDRGRDDRGGSFAGA